MSLQWQKKKVNGQFHKNFNLFCFFLNFNAFILCTPI